MPDQGNHCPFLNRADRRCSEHFSLDHLQHAFKYCFDRYTTCPMYMELLAERRSRREREGVNNVVGITPLASTPAPRPAPSIKPIPVTVQIRIAGGVATHRPPAPARTATAA